MESITTAVSSVLDLVGTMLTEITTNPLLCVIFASGFVGLALTVLRKVIRTSKAV